MAYTTSELIPVTGYGATGDGSTDDTAAIQAALDAAGTFGTGVWFPPASGGCYRTTGVSVPPGLTGLYGSACLSRAGGPTVTGLAGSVLAGNYFRAGTTGSNTLAISFGVGLTTPGRDPAAVVQGNTLDLNGSTSVQALAQFNGFAAADVASSGGGEYRNNLAHNHGAAMPASWVGQWVGSDGLAIPNTTTATLDLAAGPVLSA